MQNMLTTADSMQGKTAPRVDRKRWLAVLAMVAVLASGSVWAAAAEVNNGQDPTRPLTRFDLRYQYQNLPPEDHDNAHIFTLRADRPFALSQRWNLATRLDLPLFLRATQTYLWALPLGGQAGAKPMQFPDASGVKAALPLCTIALIAMFLTGYVGYFVVDARWLTFYYAPLTDGKNVWLGMQLVCMPLYAVDVCIACNGLRRASYALA